MPLTVAVVVVMPVTAPVITVGGGSVHVNVTDGCAPVAVGTSEKPDTPRAAAGTPDAPPPPPPAPEA